MHRETFSAFNGLRMVAAFGVICLHYGTLTQGFATLPGFLQNVARNGAMALPFFFILSGFVLTHAYVDRISCPQSIRRFYLFRFARLYPVYLFSFALFLPVAAEKYLLHPVATEQHGLRTFSLGGLLALFLLQSWTPLSQAWNGPGWSLSVEALFYLLFPWLLPRVLSMRRAGLIAGLSVPWLCMMALTIAHERAVISTQFWHSYLGYQPLFWSPLFLLGIATYRLKPLWSQIPGPMAEWIAAGLIVILVMLCGLPAQPGGNLLVNGGAAPLLALTVVAFAHPRLSSNPLLCGPLLTMLGGASYIIYILQAPVWHIFRRVTDHLRHADAAGKVADWQFLLYVPLVLGVSFMVQRLVEKPAQQWLLRRQELKAAESISASRFLAGA